ncbi:MAG TPA: two-component regulator propeller domain-containing protein [Blastocatellia bacterium]|nr:two-component regulator propeller domain-containing protein [Blastocatellia bacterium]
MVVLVFRYVGQLIGGLAAILVWIALGVPGVSGQVQQEAAKGPIRQFSFDQWEAKQGLPNSEVQAIAQTRDGYLWLGTQEGLARFDGAHFTVFDRRNTREIKHSNVQCLIEGGDGSLWIGTLGGLVRLKDGKFASFTTKEGLAHDFINSLYEDHEGRLWIGTFGGGLDCFKGGRFTHYTARDGLANDFVSAITEDHTGNLWIGTQGGLDCFKNDRFIHYTTREGLPNNQIWATYESRDRSLWIGTSGGLVQLKNGKFTTYLPPHDPSHKTVKAIYEDAAGALWIGTYGGGLNRLLDGKFHSFTTGEGLSHDFVCSIYQDREGSIWIGTEGGGLNRLRDDKFVTYTTKEGLTSDSARTVYQSRDGAIWIGTSGGGVSRLKDGHFSHYTTRDGLADDLVFALFEDRSGVMWFGTNSGLCRLKYGRFTTYTMKDGLSHDMVRAIFEDRAGRLWVGTRGGLDCLQDGKFTNYTGRGFPSNAVRLIYEDRAGDLWIGGNKGLSRFKDGRFTTYTTEQGLSHNFAYTMIEDHAEDHDGTFWIGTYGGGLNRLRHGKFTRFTTKEGLFDDIVLQVLDDRRGNLWMSCNKGVFRVDKRQLNDYADGKISAINSVSYGLSDGMKSPECSGSSQPAGWRTIDGRLWFPTTKGMAVIDPATTRIDPFPPQVQIENVVADDQTTTLTGKTEPVRFAPGTVRLEINYSGISLSAPDKVRFRYRLDGFDHDWIDAGARRAAYYTNLPPGSYSFRVMAGNNDGVWNETVALSRFDLAPHFYQRSWFFLLCATLIAGIGWTIHRIRLRQLQSRFSAVLNERNRIAREMHDTLIHGIVGASALLGAVAKLVAVSPQQAHDYLEMARVELKNSLDEVRAAVSSLREQTGEMSNLPAGINSLMQRLTAGETVSAQCVIRGEQQTLPDEIAENLLRIGREAIVNAIRHSAASRIVAEMRFDPHQFELDITDNGVGFDPERTRANGSPHFGLIGMRERAAVIGGELILESQPGAGTKVLVRVPLHLRLSGPTAKQAKYTKAG